MANLILQLRDYRLTTAEIVYHLPDHPKLLQQYLWQEYDLAPHFPELRRFLNFWEKKLDGKLHSVRVASKKLITADDLRFAQSEYLIH
jgi:uncharacterized protein Usg